jgi:hypothetical protein
MGDWQYYTSETFKPNQTTDLAQACYLGVQIGQRALQHLAVARILRGLKLLPDEPARQFNRLFPPSSIRLLRRKSLF